MSSYLHGMANCLVVVSRAKMNILNVRIRFEFVRDDYCNSMFEITVKMVDTSEYQL